MSKRKHYDHEFKVQAVKLALQIGQTKACNELKLPENTIYGWMHAWTAGSWARHTDTSAGLDDE